MVIGEAMVQCSVEIPRSPAVLFVVHPKQSMQDRSHTSACDRQKTGLVRVPTDQNAQRTSLLFPSRVSCCSVCKQQQSLHCVPWWCAPFGADQAEQEQPSAQVYQSYFTSMKLPIPVNVITGALGVGKTTAIQHLLAQRPPEEKWAVLVNEFGTLGIDAALLEAGKPGKVRVMLVSAS